MNTGLQDAFNLGWKLALVCRGEAGDGLLDTYETERRPVAELVVDSGDRRRERTGSDRPGGASCPRCRAPPQPQRSGRGPSRGGGRCGDRPLLPQITRGRRRRAARGWGRASCCRTQRRYNRSTASRGRCTSSPITRATRCSCSVVRKATRPGSTALVAELAERSWAIVDAVLGLSTHPGPQAVGRLADSVAARLDVTDVTVLAVRPDRYIGLRDDTRRSPGRRRLPRRARRVAPGRSRIDSLAFRAPVRVHDEG